jgi:polyisoprenoid-binding protein YceI
MFEIDIQATGMLSRWGHDLRLSLDDFEIRVDAEGRVEATFDPESIRVEGALVEGEIDPSELSDSDHEEIRGNIQRDVLETDDYEKARFEGTWEGVEGGDAFEVEGELELVGRREPLATRVSREEGRCRAEIGLTQSKWGIEPYSAMMGALKVEDRILVRFDLPDVSDTLA